jgi:hypothetical protein
MSAFRKRSSIPATLVAMVTIGLAACSDGPTAPQPAVTRALDGARASVVLETLDPANPVCTVTQGVRIGLGYLGGTGDNTTVGGTSYALDIPGLGTINYTTNAANTTLTTWSSTFPIYAVIMRGGNNANVYRYTDGATSGEGTVTPLNAGGQTAQISHVNFCWDGHFAFASGVTGTPSYTRDYAWTIAKSVKSGPTTILTGGSVSVTYAVTMTPSFTDRGWTISGDVTITNPVGYGASGTFNSVTVQVGTEAATVTCPALPATLASGATTTCTYSRTVSQAGTYPITATVVGTGKYHTTTVDGSVTFGDPTTLIDEAPTVYDTPFGLTPITLGTADLASLVNGSQTFERIVTWETPGLTACGPASVSNTARFEANDTENERGTTDAVVHNFRVTGCTLDATVDGTASFTRDYDWTLEKSVTSTGTETTVPTGGTAKVGYKVIMTPTLQDGGYAIAGTVTVTNPAAKKFGTDGTLGALTVQVGTVAATVTCTTPAASLAEGASYTCTYAAAVSDASPREVTASIAAAGDWAASASAATTVSFDGVQPTVTDGSATVSDAKYSGFANGGLVQASAGATEFTYDVDWPAGTACGPQTVTNTASFEASDRTGDTAETDDSGSDEASRTIRVTGCALAAALTGTPSFTRDYNWTIAKTVTSTGTVTSVAKDQVAPVQYQVVVTPTPVDGAYAISGTVTVTNPTANGFGTSPSGLTVDVTISGVSGTVKQCTLGAIAQGGSADCTYTATVANADPRTVTATIGTAGDWTGGTTSTLDVTFGAPTTIKDQRVDVLDTPTGMTPVALGTIDAGTTPGSTTYTPTITWPASATCGTRTVSNTASYTGSEGETGSSTATRTVEVTGCVPPITVTGQTAFGYLSPTNGSVLLNTLPGASNKWGWTIPLTPSGGRATVTLPVYAGAGSNDISKGTLVGSVTITYTESSGTNPSVRAEWTPAPGLQSPIVSTSIFAGKTKAPCKRGVVPVGETCSTYDVAPGQLTIGKNLTGKIWVIYHLSF